MTITRGMAPTTGTEIRRLITRAVGTRLTGPLKTPVLHPRKRGSRLTAVHYSHATPVHASRAEVVPAEGRRRQPRVLAAPRGGPGGLRAILALADIKTTHSAFEDDHDDYRYGRRWDDDYDGDQDDDDDDDGSGDDSRYEIQELIDSEVALTHWTGPDGTRLEETSLPVDGTEVCASTPTGDLAPYSSQYEGYMGNWGNTLDRWYHRAAVVVWPREQAFANRAETSPAWALDELAAMVSAGDVPGAQAAAATLAPFWNAALSDDYPPEPLTSGIYRAIRLSATAAVLAAAGIAAYISYWHAYAVVRAHGESGIAARLEAATIDGLMYASSMVVLYAARHRVPVPSLARWLLGLGIAATLTANMAQGWSHGPVGAVVAAWPAVSLLGSYELLVWLFRTSGTVEHRPPAGHLGDAEACRAAGVLLPRQPPPPGSAARRARHTRPGTAACGSSRRAAGHPRQRAG
jgi:hypothetical protein